MNTESEKPRVSEVIVVEGRYDRNTVAQVVEALIFETGGFAIFNNPARRETLRTLAAQRGAVILTDSDNAGRVIRGYLKGILPEEKIRQAYVPAIPGRERRKEHPSRQGLLGVEGMTAEVILEALRRAGATFTEPGSAKAEITAADFYRLGLTGKPESEQMRQKLAENLGLPGEISQKDLRKAVGWSMTVTELEGLLLQLTEA